MKTSANQFLPAAYALIMFTTSGCVMTQVQQAPVGEVVTASPAPARVRLTMRDGRRVDLHDPSIVGDSIVGYSWPSGDIRRTRRAEATSDVATTSIARTDTFASTVVALAIAGGVAFALLLNSMRNVGL